MTAENYTPTLFAKDIDEWRLWLANNCRSESRIFLVVFHKSSKTASVHWHEAIEHALCFGWVDSIAHKRDSESCYLKFTPRNPKSKWGKKNIERANRMISFGFMRQPGLELIEKAKSTGKWLTEDEPNI
jgi:uncharacterized protein YdeI (YjbR/CyaY-like superfamily)